MGETNSENISSPPLPAFASRLLGWYARHARSLPWRQTRDPYRIWLSEVILQQTRVAQGLPYYERFLAAFPDVTALARADEQAVLRLWQGLGYYSRARHLHATARHVAHERQGQFPDHYAALRRLPGVGPYTAAAIASFAFGEHVAVVDGNVYRVLARHFGLTDDIASPAGQRVFRELAQAVLPAQQSDTYNQAIMELGALQCVPARPKCLTCPVQHSCVALATGQQAALPVKAKRTQVRQRYFHYLVVGDEAGHLWLRQRGAGDIWQGLFDFWLIEAPTPLTAEALLATPDLAAFGRLDVRLVAEQGPMQHVLTHQRLEAYFYRLVVGPSAAKWLARHAPQKLVQLTPAEVAAVPKPVLITNYLAEI